MITRPQPAALGVLRDRQWYLVGAAAYAALVVFLFRSGHDWIDVPVAVPAMLGTALSVLLGFRTASAYDRWWEARKLWGAIVNDSRTLARQVLTLLCREDGTPPVALQREIIYRQIAWTYALARSLRGQDALADAAPPLAFGPLLADEEIDALRSQRNVPNALLQTQQIRIRDAHRDGLLDRYFFLNLESTLKRLTDHLGACERIKHTVFPSNYSQFVSRTLVLFYAFLPAGLAPYLGWFTIPAALIIDMLFAMIESTGRRLQDPFENQPTDTPMTALSRTIEINLRQQLGETDLPEEIEPVGGVLM